MKLARLVTIALIISAIWAVAGASASNDVGECLTYSATDFCVEWAATTPGHLGAPGGTGGGSKAEVVCFWQTVKDVGDVVVWNDSGDAPPADAVVSWQHLICSDGSNADRYRWVVVATPEDLAREARGQVVGELPVPVLAVAPPLGVASFVGVPVFVEVANWTGAVSASSCAGGLCVTVTGTPVVVFDPGDGTPAVTCAGAGSKHMTGADPLTEAAAQGSCTHIYRLRTGVDRRPVQWPGAVSVTWRLSWSASSGATGVLAAITRSVPVPRAVAEVQTVVVGGRTP